MTFLYALLPLAVFFIALLTMRATGQYIPLSARAEKLTAIDGLRGFLALSVFIHHSIMWQELIKTQIWTAPKSALFMHLGTDAVSLFFMITGFLFFHKILNSDRRPIDWKQLYRGRIFRIFPLYLFMVMLILLIVAYMTDWKWQTSSLQILKSVSRWLAGGMIPVGDVNGFRNTGNIVSSAIWTLCYEWIFYFLLPILSFVKFKSAKPPVIIILITACLAFYLFWVNGLEYKLFLNFASGILGAYLIGKFNIPKFAHTIWASIVILLLAGGIMLLNLNYYYSLIPLTIIFILINNGCSFFGILTSAPARRLGEISFSLYLLHGIIIFTTFKILLTGKVSYLTLHPIVYLGVICLITIPLVLFCSLTYKQIELKGLAWGKKK